MFLKRKPKSRFKYKYVPNKRRAPVRLSKAVLAAAEAAISSEEFKAWLRRYEEFRDQYPFEEFTEPPPS
jgi:hypothetical protein